MTDIKKEWIKAAEDAHYEGARSVNPSVSIEAYILEAVAPLIAADARREALEDDAAEGGPYPVICSACGEEMCTIDRLQPGRALVNRAYFSTCMWPGAHSESGLCRTQKPRENVA